MPLLLRMGMLPVLLGLLWLTGCKKEVSCERCADNTPGTPATGNRPPVARAGADTTLNLPDNWVTLDGSASTDPDNNIAAYQWKKIRGPVAARFSRTDSSIIRTTGLEEGVYAFELTVTDAGGLSDKDTVLVTVQETNRPATCTVACDGSTRQLVYTKLAEVGTISISGTGVMAAAAGNTIVFAGAYARFTHPIDQYGKVDILDVATNTWTAHTLPQPRAYGAGAVLGSTIYLAASDNSGSASFPVDVFNTATGRWSTIDLPHRPGRGYVVAAAAAGTKVLFVSGAYNSTTAPSVSYTIVDIYDAVTGHWRTDTLHRRTRDLAVSTLPDDGMAATVIGTRVYIAGNASDWNAFVYGTVSVDIDIYDAATGTWSTGALRDGRGFMAALAVGARNYWAGGIKSWWNTGASHIEQTCTDVVEIRDMTTGAATFGCLSYRRSSFSAVQKDQKIIFFTGEGCGGGIGSLTEKAFDIYDTQTNTWAVGVLPSVVRGAAIVSLNNTVYVVGGTVDGSQSAVVWKLEF